MKASILFALLSVVVGGTAARAQYFPDGYGFDGVERQKVDIKLQDATTDDYVISIARAADLDFLADSTDFSEQKALSGSFNDSLGSLIRDFYPNKDALSTWRVDKRTYLLWKQPDLIALGKKFIAGQDIARVTTPLDDRAVEKLLDEYLLKEKQFDVNDPKGYASSPIGDLPPDLRRAIVATVQSEVLSPRALANSSKYFSDEFWKSARIQIGAGDKPGRAMLWIKSAAQGTGSQGALGLGMVDPILPSPFTGYEIPPGIAPAAPGFMPTAPVERAYLKDAPAAAETAGLLPSAALVGEAALSAKASLEVKHQPLREFLAEVQKQTDVALTCAADADAVADGARITARVKGKPLHEVLSALSRLYGVRWSRGEGGTYQMHPSGLSEVDTAMLRLGDWRHFSMGRRSPYNGAAHLSGTADVSRDVINEVGVDEFRKPGGISVSELSETTQQMLRRQVEHFTVELIVEDRYLASAGQIESYSLSADVLPMKVMVNGTELPSPNVLHFNVRDVSSGRSISELHSIKPPEAQNEAAARRAYVKAGIDKPEGTEPQPAPAGAPAEAGAAAAAPQERN